MKCDDCKKPFVTPADWGDYDDATEWACTCKGRYIFLVDVDGKRNSMYCRKCNVTKEWASCDGAFGCVCSAHHHIEYHEKWDIIEANPSLGKMTINQLEGFEVDR